MTIDRTIGGPSKRLGDSMGPIAFERYRLDNGLDVILHTDHRAPIVHLLLWYHVGSKNEPPHRTGFAHLFEHMMFQGSEHVGKMEHFRHVQQVGGVLNGTTSQDRTNYYESLPREHLGLGLWLEADRMRSLRVTEENFQNQLAVVKEEKKQNYDNRPYGLWYPTIVEMIFAGSPYGWAPIGDMDHLESASIDAVREFHGRFYRPNNATLVICGDFDPHDAKRLVVEQFGSIEPGPAIERPRVAPEPIRSQRRREMTERVPLDALWIGWQVPSACHDDAVVLSLLAMIIGSGRSSRLRRRLVRGLEIAQNVSATNRAQEDAGIFLVHATAAEEVALDILEDEIWRELDRLASDGVEKEELQGVINRYEMGLMRTLGTLHGVGELLAHCQVICGDASGIDRILHDYREVTPDDIRRVAEHLRPERAAVLTMKKG